MVNDSSSDRQREREREGERQTGETMTLPFQYILKHSNIYLKDRKQNKNWTTGCNTGQHYIKKKNPY